MLWRFFEWAIMPDPDFDAWVGRHLWLVGALLVLMCIVASVDEVVL